MRLGVKILSVKSVGKSGVMGMLLHRQDGTVREWVVAEGRLRDVRSGAFVRKRDKRREYVPGGVVSMWNLRAYEEYENSEAGLRERLEWERDMLSQVEQA